MKQCSYEEKEKYHRRPPIPTPISTKEKELRREKKRKLTPGARKSKQRKKNRKKVKRKQINYVKLNKIKLIKLNQIKVKKNIK